MPAVLTTLTVLAAAPVRGFTVTDWMLDRMNLQKKGHKIEGEWEAACKAVRVNASDPYSQQLCRPYNTMANADYCEPDEETGFVLDQEECARCAPCECGWRADWTGADGVVHPGTCFEM